MADPGTTRPAVELKAFQVDDPLTVATREFEVRYPTADELAAVGPDNIKLFADHLIDGEHLLETEVEAAQVRGGFSCRRRGRVRAAKRATDSWTPPGAILIATARHETLM